MLNMLIVTYCTQKCKTMMRRTTVAKFIFLDPGVLWSGKNLESV